MTRLMRLVASFRKNGFSTKSSIGILVRKLLGDVRPGGQHDHRDTRGLRPVFELFHQLAAVHPRHAVIADQKIGGIVDGFEQRVGGIAGSSHDPQRGERALQHAHDHGVVIY